MFKKTKNRLKLLSCYFALRKERENIRAYVDFISDQCWQLFKPLQIKGEIEQLLSLIQQRAPSKILEIGTANGGTLFLFARVAAPNATLLSLDLPAGNYGGGYSPIRIPLYLSFARNKQKIFLLRGNSHDRSNVDRVTNRLGEAKLDFLFIDGDHSYEGVKKDFELYSPLVRSGGVIAFHDVASHAASDACDVDRFWNEIKNNFKHLEIIESQDQGWAGIGVLFLT